MISKRYSNFNDFVPLSRGEKGNIDYKLSNNFQSAFEIVIKFYSNRLSRSFFIIIIIIIVALQFQPFFSQVFFPFLLGVKSPLNPSPRFFCKNKRKATVEKKKSLVFSVHSREGIPSLSCFLLAAVFKPKFFAFDTLLRWKLALEFGSRQKLSITCCTNRK